MKYLLGITALLPACGVASYMHEVQVDAFRDAIETFDREVMQPAQCWDLCLATCGLCREEYCDEWCSTKEGKEGSEPSCERSASSLGGL